MSVLPSSGHRVPCSYGVLNRAAVPWSIYVEGTPEPHSPLEILALVKGLLMFGSPGFPFTVLPALEQ